MTALNLSECGLITHLSPVRAGSLVAITALLPKVVLEREPVISRFKFCKRKHRTSVDSFERSSRAIGHSLLTRTCHNTKTALEQNKCSCKDC